VHIEREKMPGKKKRNSVRKVWGLPKGGARKRVEVSRFWVKHRDRRIGQRTRDGCQKVIELGEKSKCGVAGVNAAIERQGRACRKKRQVATFGGNKHTP